MNNNERKLCHVACQPQEELIGRFSSWLPCPGWLRKLRNHVQAGLLSSDEGAARLVWTSFSAMASAVRAAATAMESATERAATAAEPATTTATRPPK